MPIKKKGATKGKAAKRSSGISGDDKITFRCPEDLYNFLDKYSKKEGRSMSNAVVYILRRFESEASQTKMFP